MTESENVGQHTAMPAASAKELHRWQQEKKYVPEMIQGYCRHKHKAKRKELGLRRKEVCPECKELMDYAIFRLEKCPFKVNKKFCAFCKIHCYKPDMRIKIKDVMKYIGPRSLFVHPIFALSHLGQMIKFKRQKKKEAAARAKAEAKTNGEAESK